MKLLSKYRWYVVTAVVLGGALVWYALAGASGGRGGYETKAVDKGTIERVVSASGPVNAVVTVLVGTQVSGQVAVLDADFNARVKKGQRLALIDPQSFQSRVAQAESDLAAARTQRSLQAANVTRAEAQLVKERRALERLETLMAKGFTSAAQMDAQKAVIASSTADVSVAKAQVENAQANIAAREAALAQAKIDLSRTEIFSPIDGIVIERNVDRGQTVAASLQAPTLFKIAQDLSQIQIEAQVDEADIGGVKEGQPVTFTVGSYAQREFRGRVGQVRVGGLNALPS
jgi:HlyD family secretion protein